MVSEKLTSCASFILPNGENYIFKAKAKNKSYMWESEI